MTNQTPNTRTCSACGLQKPLLAFLELAGAEGHRYGSICSACRGAGLGQSSPEETEQSDNSSGTTRFQLDHKARMQTELEKTDQFKLKTELDHEEKAKKDSTALEKTSESELLEKADKKQREEYLNSKSDFLTRPRTEKQKTATRSSEGKWQNIQNALQEKGQALTSQSQREANKQEIQKTGADVSLVSIDAPDATVGRSGGSAFDAFRKMLGESAAVNNSQKKYREKSQQASTKRSPSFLATAPKGATKDDTKTKDKNLAAELLDNYSSRRKL